MFSATSSPTSKTGASNNVWDRDHSLSRKVCRMIRIYPRVSRHPIGRKRHGNPACFCIRKSSKQSLHGHTPHHWSRCLSTNWRMRLFRGVESRWIGRMCPYIHRENPLHDHKIEFLVSVEMASCMHKVFDTGIFQILTQRWQWRFDEVAWIDEFESSVAECYQTFARGRDTWSLVFPIHLWHVL